MHVGGGQHRYELIESWAHLPAGASFVDVPSIAIGDDDEVVILTRTEDAVWRFDPEGQRLDSWGAGHFSDRPHGLAIGPGGNVYTADDGNHTVRKFAPDGDHLLTIGSENDPSDTGFRDDGDVFERLASIERGAGPFNKPTDVTVLETGDIHVSDGYGNARIHGFDADGEVFRSVGNPGAGPSEFRLPHAIDHDSEGRLWVADRENSRLQIFDTDGQFVDEWTDLIRPTDVAVDGGTVYVSELCNRVSVFTIEGDRLARWGNADHEGDDRLFVAPHAIAVDSTGDVYVGEVPVTYVDEDRGARTVRKFRRTR